MPNSTPNAPRILFLDDNVRDIGGHYLELASLLAEGGAALGYGTTLACHASLPSRNPDLARDTRLANIDVDACFHVRRMENWSLGVDGRSRVGRRPGGKPADSNGFRNVRQRFRDLACRPNRRPSAMLSGWASGFVAAMNRFRPGRDDIVVVNTGGDFQLLALAEGLKRWSERGGEKPLTLHVIFHFALFDQMVDRTAIACGRQVNATLRNMSPHRVHLHATTESLAAQLSAVGVDATAIPYPTRFRPSAAARRVGEDPIRLLLAGMPRAEKGRDKIYDLLTRIESPQLRSGKYVWSMQLPKKRWERMIPSGLHAYCRPDSNFGGSSPIEVLRGNLTSSAYHDWLDTADIGLFLYDAQRYVARCSGVLLEMMMRGVPVIVPDHCWLADQVRQAESTGQIGWIYSSTDELPERLEQLPAELDRVRENCRRHADYIAVHHSGKNTLRKMGIADARVAPKDAAA